MNIVVWFFAGNVGRKCAYNDNGHREKNGTCVLENPEGICIAMKIRDENQVKSYFKLA